MAVIALFLFGLTGYSLKLHLPIVYIIVFGIIIYGVSFVIIQYRIEKFIYQRIKDIYQEVALLNIKDLKKAHISPDMKTLSKEVQKFAHKKLSEIENLNEQAQFRREFMGNVAHELKTPLFSIQGYLLTLLDGNVTDKKQKKKYLKQAAKNVDRLVNIVEDLDFISKMDSKHLHLNIQEFDIVELTRSVFELKEINAQQHAITLDFDREYYPILVYGDMKRIEQVLENLLTNAIKYAKKSSVCHVSFNPVDDHRIKVCVKDSSEGIAPQHLSRIFERFYRVDSGRSRQEGGSGLGLSIVKHIIEAHGEEVSVDSTIGVGSRFCFTLERVNL